MSLTRHPLALGEVASGNHIKAAANDEAEPGSEESLQAADEAYTAMKNSGELDRRRDEWAFQLERKQRPDLYRFPGEGE